MSMRHLRTWTVAASAIGAVLLGGSKQARADILVTVVSGSTTSTIDTANNNAASVTFTNVGGYTGTVHTVITNYPGTSAQGQISTTVNVTGETSTAPGTLTTYVQLVASSPNTASPFSNPMLPWTGPSTSPVVVSAGASLAPQTGLNSGSVTTTTYYNSPPAANGSVATPVVTASQPTPTGNSPLANVTLPNSGTYSLGQVVTLSGVSLATTSTLFNFGGTSSVNAVPAVPEPSTLALAGLGSLGLIGYGVRRRKVMGA
jgi:hypothetical protein